MNEDTSNTNDRFDSPHHEEVWPEDPGPTSSPAAAAPAPPGGTPPSKPTWKTWVAVAATAAIVGAAAVFGISAATSDDDSDDVVATQGNGNGNGAAQIPGGQGALPSGLGGFGEIASIDGSTLTIEDQNGEATEVITTDSTSVTKTVEGDVDDISVGDTVTVMGTGSSTEIEATSVTNEGVVDEDEDQGGFGNGGPPGGGQMPGGTSGQAFTSGVVQSVGDGTFTLTDFDDATVTVTTSSSTEVSVTKEVEVGDLEVGETVIVQGDEEDGTITADSIREAGGFGGGFPGGGPNSDGSSESSDGSTQ